MKNFRTLLLASIILLFTAFAAEAGTRATMEVEVIEGGKIEKSTEITTFDEKRFRLDLPGANKKKTEQSPYIMTVDGGENWIIGDRKKSKFYCSKMKTEEFFKNLGDQVTDAIEFFNVKVKSPSVKQNLEEPGPEIQGYKTTHIQVETNAKAYARILFVKFEYRVKVIDDLWYTTDIEMHPVKKKWMNALTNSGNSTIDSLFSDVTTKLPGPILKAKSVINITNVRKKETKTREMHAIVTKVEELNSSELDKIFKMPKCEIMDDDEVQDKAKALFSADKIML